MSNNPNILVRSETALEAKALGATHMDDLDLIISPKDGALVAVAMKDLGMGSQHVCWRCGKAFNDAIGPMRRTEVKLGYSRILLHAKCESNEPSLYVNNLEGMQHRRELASAARVSKSVAAAAAESRKRIII
jgi:hypothetical protein